MPPGEERGATRGQTSGERQKRVQTRISGLAMRSAAGENEGECSLVMIRPVDGMIQRAPWVPSALSHTM